MSLSLDRTERRVVGCLIEKELSVPEAYPLTVNALVLACNQKSNRDPEMSLAEHEVAGAVQSLMAKGWVAELEMTGARTRRYAHKAREQLAIDEQDLAIVAELLLRGPQSPPELEKRAARMRPVGAPDAVEARLKALADRPVPYVRFLGRRTGERVPRWEHTLGSEPAASTAGAGAAAEEPAGSSGVAAPPPPAPTSASVESLVARVERL